MYFDSHAHLTEDCFAQDVDSIVENMKAASVTGMMEIGFDLPSSEKAVQLAERFSWVTPPSAAIRTTPRRWTRRGSPSTASCAKTRA